MGGFGSTRWGDYRKRRTCDASIQLRISDFSAHMAAGGTLLYQRIRVDIFASEFIELAYTLHGVRIQQVIATARGVKRLYFVCPLCAGRRASLYLAPGEQRFACRHCYNLTWETSQAHLKNPMGEIIRKVTAHRNRENRPELTYLDGSPVRPEPELTEAEQALLDQRLEMIRAARAGQPLPPTDVVRYRQRSAP